MAIDFKKFNKQFPADKVKKDMQEAQENGGGSKLPDGEYTCKLDKMELGESKKGALMIRAQFRIIEGDHKKQCIFKNQVLTGTKNDGFMMVKAKEFLESLDSGEEIVFEDWEQFNDLILDIAEIVQEDDLRYLIVLDTDGEYQNAEIADVIEV